MKQGFLKRVVISSALFLTVTLATPLAHAQGATSETAPAVDFTQPVFSAPIENKSVDDYLDTFALNNNRSCPERPYRPGWLMVHTRSFMWRSELGQLYAASLSVPSVIEAGVCTCELKWVDWEALRPEIETLWESISGLPDSQWSDGTRLNHRRLVRKIRRSYSSKLGPYARLCSKAGI